MQAAVPRRVWTGTGWLVGGRLYGAVASAALWVLLARHLSAEEFGRAGFYVGFLYLLEALVDLGTGTATVRLAAQDPASVRAVLLTVRRVRVATAFLAFLEGTRESE